MEGDKLGRFENIIVITDANILIDYVKADKELLNLLCSLFKSVKVPFDILNEVNELTLMQAQEFNIDVYYPEPETYYEASNELKRISFQDLVCFIDARKYGWAVITNDKSLKEYCNQKGIETFWGLQVMMFMVEEHLLTKRAALKTARRIVKNNPRIHEDILLDFEEKVMGFDEQHEDEIR